MRRPLRCAALASVLVACGASPEPEAPAAPPASGGAEWRVPREGMQVEGLMGTIPQRKILATLEPKLPKFQRCFFHGANEVELIAGQVELYFRVGLDGRVEWVYLRDSSVGHLATERCVLEEAARARFPEPKGGGPAELAWGFELDALDRERAPIDWDADSIAEPLAAGRAALEACASGSFVVTVYIAPGGQVLAAGAAADSRHAAEGIPCVVEAVQQWSMPDPGAHTAKVRFRVP
jgi:hypothetical protein